MPDHNHKHKKGWTKLKLVDPLLADFPLEKLELPSQKSMTDLLAKNVEALWKTAFPDASILPVIGFPSNSKGVMTLTHTMGADMPKMSINGLTSSSPLANNALYSAEVIDGHWLNLYEIMIPDVPGKNGELSSAQIYVNALRDQGLDVNGTHFHWYGASVLPGNTLVAAVHHTATNMDPITFTKKTLAAIHTGMKAVLGRLR